jgi:DNA topoisomerase-2
MTKAYPPIITPASESETKLSDFTKITFEPDLAKFQVSNSDIGVKPSHLLKDTVKIFRRRTIDIAACVPTVEVSFNGTKTPINSFKDYVSLFAPSSSSSSEPQNISAKELSGEHTDRNPVFYQKVSDRWEIGVMKSLSGSFENISFVNSVWTPDGGSHVNLVTSQIIRAFQDELSKRGAPIVQPNTIRSRLMVFVRSNIENPSFESQSKLSLSSKPTSFGSTCDLPQTFLKTLVEKSGILDEIMLDIKYREEAKLLKAFSGPRKSSGTNLVDIPKLEDALLAGNTQHALECTLILTEGDSAKALAIAGLEVVGRDKFGVLPLRGKILNVRAAATSQMLKNEELSNICKTLGLNFNETFEKGIKDKGLRYGKVLLMCDQDHDGSHIKGLVINFFQHFWPNLLLNEDFLQQFITPLVKATPIGTQTTNSDRKSSKPILSFYSLQEYQAWRQKVKPDSSSSSIGSPDDNNGTKLNDSGYRIKYYKGLGTNTADEGKEYFRKLDRHLKQFVMNPGGADAIDLAFSKSRAADRRKWLASCYDADTFIDPNKKQIAYGDFVNKELIQFSFSDNQRSIPSVVDGLKPSQRKILYACFKKKLTNDMKVVQLAGYVAEHTAYHHGEASLHAAIVNMAQDFVGSSNVPLLVPSGQFGTRAQGGNDYASPRYIFTRLSPLTRLLFPNEDDAHLKPLEEDGQLVEPKYFLPVIPTLLVNGAQGIGKRYIDI